MSGEGEYILAFAVMVMLRHESVNGRTLVFMIERPWFSSSEMIMTSTPLPSLHHIFSKTVSPWMFASTVGLNPTAPKALPLEPEASLLSSLDMRHLPSKTVGSDVLLALCPFNVFTFSSSCFTYSMVLPRRDILSVWKIKV